MHHHLSLLVELDTFVVVVGGTCRLNQIFKRFVAPARVVRAVFCCCAAEQGSEEVIRIPVVAGPAHHHGLVLACFRTLQIFAPLVGDDLGLDANFGPVSLDHLSHTARVRVVRTLYRHCPQIDGEAFFHPGFFQQRFRFFRIVSVVFNVVVIAPHGRWNQVFRGLTCALVNGFDNRFFIYRIGQRLADLHVIQRFLLGVEGEIADVQARLFQQVNAFIFFHARDVGRVRVRHHLALILLQFGIAHGSIRGNGEDQAIDLRLGAPVAREGFIENTGVFLILQQLERTGTDWVQVHFFR